MNKKIKKKKKVNTKYIRLFRTNYRYRYHQESKRKKEYDLVGYEKKKKTK